MAQRLGRIRIKGAEGAADRVDQTALDGMNRPGGKVGKFEFVRKHHERFRRVVRTSCAGHVSRYFFTAVPSDGVSWAYKTVATGQPFRCLYYPIDTQFVPLDRASVAELTKNATQMANETFAVVEPFLAVAVLYWVLIEAIARSGRWIERRVRQA